MSLDDKLYGWDAALECLIRRLQAYRAAQEPGRMMPSESGWDDAIYVARVLIGEARTQKGFLARECAAAAKKATDAG